MGCIHDKKLKAEASTIKKSNKQQDKIENHSSSHSFAIADNLK